MHLSLHFRFLPTMAVASTLSLLPIAAHGQAVTGAGADAIAVPKGSVKVRFGGLWDGYNEWLSENGRIPYLSGLATEALGVRHLPQLGPVQQAINGLLGDASTFQLSLGTLEAKGDARSSTTPIAIDVGITSRLSIGIVVPYVETRNNASLILNRDGTSANVGKNPAYNATNGSSAHATNGMLLRQLARARTQLSSEISRCAIATEHGCDAIRANSAGASALTGEASQVENFLSVVYGDSIRGGSPVVPIVGSSTQVAINNRIGALRAGFEHFGVLDLLDGVFPASATTISGPGSLPSIVNDTAYGLDYTHLGGTRRAGIGDVDITASYLWWNTLGHRPAQWLNASSFGLRSIAVAGWRFGTAGADRTEDAFDVPIGDGANALLVRSTTDVVFNKWFWLSGTARMVQPFRDKVMMRRPLFADSLLFVPAVTASAQRSLGRRVEVEVIPRISIGRFIGLSGGYVMRRTDANRFAFGASDSLHATTITAASRTSQAMMFGATFSTMASYIQGRAKWPVEVVYEHSASIRGSGGRSPAASADRLELRIYTGYPRR